MGACAQDVHYSSDQYGNPKDGYRFYTEKMGVQVVAASQEVFFAKILVDSHMAELLHGWDICFSEKKKHPPTKKVNYSKIVTKLS